MYEAYGPEQVKNVWLTASCSVEAGTLQVGWSPGEVGGSHRDCLP